MQAVKLAFSPDPSVFNFFSTATRLHCCIPTTPPSLVRCTNHPFINRRRNTKRPIIARYLSLKRRHKLPGPLRLCSVSDYSSYSTPERSRVILLLHSCIMHEYIIYSLKVDSCTCSECFIYIVLNFKVHVKYFPPFYSRTERTRQRRR